MKSFRCFNMFQAQILICLSDIYLYVWQGPSTSVSKSVSSVSAESSVAPAETPAPAGMLFRLLHVAFFVQHFTFCYYVLFSFRTMLSVCPL